MGRGITYRLSSFIEKPKSESGCWKWLGNKHAQGYGKIGFIGKTWLAHRLSYELLKGPIPKNMMVCHACDNPECTNPEHLFLGTAQENMYDKISKGRHKGAAKGDKHHTSKLTTEDVREIRKIYSMKLMNQYELADSYSVTQSEISNIVNFKRWGHIL
jgi:hypothetical protein